MNTEFRIEHWQRSHPNFAALDELFDGELDGSSQLYHDFDWEEEVFIFVALHAGEATPIGLLKMVVHKIGADMGRGGLLLLGDEVLYEGKVMEFVVKTSHRRQGIGRALQQYAIEKAKARGCYQFRSHSGGDRTANHQLKLSMGFAVDPIIRGDDSLGAYFLLPLRMSE